MNPFLIRTYSILIRIKDALLTIVNKIKTIGVVPLATLIISLSGLFLAYNQHNTSIMMNELQNKLHRTEIEIVEGQFVASIIPCLIKGGKEERELAILLLKKKAPTLADEILKFLSINDPNEEVRQFANREFNSLRFSNLLKDAEIMFGLRRYKESAEYFYQAAKYADKSKLNLSLLESAESRYKVNDYKNASDLFIELFKINDIKYKKEGRNHD
jgi:tetratricopeptide (TPR) repeat protein